MTESMKECLPENVKRLSDWSGIDLNEEDDIMCVSALHTSLSSSTVQ
jgi:hypothetical protein